MPPGIKLGVHRLLHLGQQGVPRRVRGNVRGHFAGPSPATRVISYGAVSGDVRCNPFGTVATSVRLRRDLSGGKCLQGSTWGYNTDEIWTKGGCRGTSR
ncbi:MAG: DUF3011 domain-containing protein [Gemmatimonadaceae bacterium]|nr:DUF3011 domain-containing protein [Gemmatimonadaceae bacterium]